MGETGHKHSSGRLGTRLRHKLAEAYSIANDNQSKLWYVFSPRSDRDWVLKGNLQWGHFLWVESDATVKTVEYGGVEHSVSVGEQMLLTRFDAVLTFKDGRIEYREILESTSLDGLSSASQLKWEEKVAAAVKVGVLYRRCTDRDIFACPQKIMNWQRVIAWLSALRGNTLVSENIAVSALIHANGGATLGDIRALGSAAEQPALVAAAFRGVLSGVFRADLERAPVTDDTFIESGDEHEGPR
ncbi:hypothetical protein [Aromatoleum petrolei]|uniref:Uncharacterized protein n=1 Tax=Aromatoleum petrolei TaxID=76116 RepID=A0ABX1MP46_9RHOO|nr:hypothetical protein [Aromatoleum petrolei]NMF88110.1 hypothetical protein [Aromatoleum petrolei]QTQ38897.1 Uncharacterized protein ToN1_48035 [Aromatoleum petrolei]